ncbi:MAG: TIGR03619 family F420-dependent LLM class oxidoreductase [Chloroflexi bacterium]|nr:TIGR03619 family F420-dependent LLM class oxidoreductase [Chloroflexota bacterium]
MRYGIYIPPCNAYASARTVADLARDAEAAGWEGLFIWDHVVMDWPDAVGDTWVTLTAVAMSTTRIRFGPTVTPIPRRHPWKLARETAALDQLSGGRLTLAVGLGVFPHETLNEPNDPKLRAEMLDEGLEVLTGLWSGESFSFHGRHYTVENATFLPRPAQQPRIPIWCGGFWPSKAPFRRAARYDGVFPLGKNETGHLSPEDFRDLIAYIKQYRTADAPFDVVCMSGTPGDDPAKARDMVAAYDKAGVTWWLEGINPWRFGWPDRFGGFHAPWPMQAMRERVLQGPHRI